MRTPLKKENVLQHFAYTWWAYLLAAVLILFSWSMIYNATEYVPPADKTLQITLVGNFVSQDVLDYYTEKAQEEFPEMEKITVDNIPLDFTGEGDYSGYTKLTVVISVGEGDIYLLNRDLLVGYSSMQAFMPLDDEVAEGGSLYGLFSDEVPLWRTIPTAKPTSTAYRRSTFTASSRRVRIPAISTSPARRLPKMRNMHSRPLPG